MDSLWLKFTLESATTFGRGEGIPGMVDQEVTFDPWGCPFLHGRTLKGLMSEVCADILHVVPDIDATWRSTADRLFGVPGSRGYDQGIMHVGHARMPAGIRAAISQEIAAGRWSSPEVVETLCAVRRQTAVEENGVPDPHTLRSMRVILRGTPFEAHLRFANLLERQDKGLLAAIALGLRRAGTARNRGRGRLSASLYLENGSDITSTWFELFQMEVNG